jgi:beta-lactamase class A
MASTFKVAVAGAVLARVDRGEVTLAQMVAVEPSRMVASEILEDRFLHPGVSLSVYNLLELMLTQSDNTATDLMTELAGGPAAVTAWLRQQGIEGQRVDRDTAGLLRDFFKLPPGVFREVLERAAHDDPTLEARGEHPNPAFDDDPRDTTTPAAMAALLARIFNGQALSPGSTAILTGIMGRCRTGAARIRGLLPAATAVAHKTGTIGGTVNDAGVITLPGGAGAIVVAIYVKKSDAPIAQRERAIAEIARSVRDYYLYAVDAGR